MKTEEQVETPVKTEEQVETPVKTEQRVETEQQLNADILEITLLIKSHYPELSKYIEEMSVTIPDKKEPEINPRNLQTYYYSLQTLVKEYSETHAAKRK